MPGVTQQDIDNDIAKRSKVIENITKKLVFSPDKLRGRKVEVTRYRDTQNKQYIRVKVGTGIVSFSSEIFGEEFEQVAREVGELLIKAADNPCSVAPEGEKK